MIRKRKNPPTKKQVWLENDIASRKSNTRGYSRKYLMSLAKVSYDQLKATGKL